MRELIKKLFRYLAKRNKRWISLYLRICRPYGWEYADVLKRHDFFYSMGENCFINPGTFLGDAKYIRLGNNVMLSTCTMIAHDGSVSRLRIAYGVRVDAIGPIDIKDNVFVGHGAIILRNVTIGKNAIVAAGSVVTKDVPAETVVAGVPARVICSTPDLVEKLKAETETLPWKELIYQRETAYDPAIEPELYRQRVKYFFENS